MQQEITAAVEFGRVCEVNGDKLRLKLSGDYLESAGQERLGQIASFVIIPIGDIRIVGLVAEIESDGDKSGYMKIDLLGQISDGKFSRGISTYPLLGDSATDALDSDLCAIFNRSGATGEAESSDLHLGRFTMNTNYEVCLSGKNFFTKHAAILGNSGAGKSCTVTRVISEAVKHPNTRIILFDLHGEYKKAFCSENGVLDPNITYLNVNDFVVPYWLLSYHELETLFVNRSNHELIPNQMSFLKESLRKLKRPSAKNLGLLGTYNVDTPVYYSLDQLKMYAENMNKARFVLNSDRYAFSKSALRSLLPAEQENILLTQNAQFNQGNAEGEIPHALYFHKLTGLLDLLDHKLNDRRYDFLLRPIEHARKSELFNSLFPEIQQERDDFSEIILWVLKLLTGDLEPTRNLTIIDLSGIPFDIIDLTVGLLTRIIFDFNFFSESTSRQPIVLFFEEAHNYIPRDSKNQSFAREAIERVAKEGRKYGVSAVVVSQRPREISHTVLSQCNNMIVMRISNPEDQDYVAKVVSDQFADLIKMLPALRPGEGFVIGDSVPMPLRTMVSLPERTPNSGNIDFLRAWSQGQTEEQIESTIGRWFRQQRPNS